MIITPHAAVELKRRQLPTDLVLQVAAGPEQVLDDRPGRKVHQSRVERPEWGKLYLLRVFIDIDREPPEIVTAYRTSKIAKYWREQKP